jgi:adenine-specific DNA-methyltransferase
VYAANKKVWKSNKLCRPSVTNKAYKNPDHHSKGNWKATPLQARSGKEKNFSHVFPNGVLWQPPKGRFSAYTHKTLDELYDKQEIRFGKNGTSIPTRKTFLSELKSE